MVRTGIREANHRCLSLIEESETRAYKGQYEGGQQKALYPVNIAPTSLYVRIDGGIDDF
jgi:hypothetical protein